jgi:hypothetical protein
MHTLCMLYLLNHNDTPFVRLFCCCCLSFHVDDTLALITLDSQEKKVPRVWRAATATAATVAAIITHVS